MEALIKFLANFYIFMAVGFLTLVLCAILGRISKTIWGKPTGGVVELELVYVNFALDPRVPCSL